MNTTNNIQPRLQNNYAQLDTSTFRCVACFTCTYEIPLWNYIAVPEASGDYCDKYYNYNGDQKWYWDADFTQLWEECPSHA